MSTKHNNVLESYRHHWVKYTVIRPVWFVLVENCICKLVRSISKQVLHRQPWSPNFLYLNLSIVLWNVVIHIENFLLITWSMESLLFFPKSIVIWTHYLPKDVLFQFQMVSELKHKCQWKNLGTCTCFQSKKKQTNKKEFRKIQPAT